MFLYSVSNVCNEFGTNQHDVRYVCVCLCDRRAEKTLTHSFSNSIHPTTDDSLFSIFYTLFDQRCEQEKRFEFNSSYHGHSEYDSLYACGSHSSPGNPTTSIYSMRLLPRVFDPCCAFEANINIYRLWFSSFDILWKCFGVACRAFGLISFFFRFSSRINSNARCSLERIWCALWILI